MRLFSFPFFGQDSKSCLIFKPSTHVDSLFIFFHSSTVETMGKGIRGCDKLTIPFIRKTPLYES